MKTHFTLWLVTPALLWAVAASSQDKVKVHVDRPLVSAHPEDVGSIEGIVRASYEAISWAWEFPVNGGEIAPSTTRICGSFP
jgi:hypothetical protein